MSEPSHTAENDAIPDELVHRVLEADRLLGPLIPGSDPEGLVRHILTLADRECRDMESVAYEALGLLRDIEGNLRAFLGGSDA